MHEIIELDLLHTSYMGIVTRLPNICFATKPSQNKIFFFIKIDWTSINIVHRIFFKFSRKVFRKASQSKSLSISKMLHKIL